MNLQLSNPFAALEVRKARKKKENENDKKKHGGSKNQRNLRLEEEIFGKKQSNVSNWADADDDDDWAVDHPIDDREGGANDRDEVQDELHESEEEIDMEEHFGVELGPEEETEEQMKNEEPTEEELALLEEHRKKYQTQPQRTLSKKELKKKEMEDFDSMLAGLGIDLKDEQKSQDSSSKKKKKKNKDKSLADEQQQQGVEKEANEIEEPKSEEVEDSEVLTPDQVKNRKEKLKNLKKRPVSKKSVEIAAAEAKARTKGKKGKKDSTHYNQAPNH